MSATFVNGKIVLDFRMYQKVEEHLNAFIHAYRFAEWQDQHGLRPAQDDMQMELDWFKDNCPEMLPVLDRWVLHNIESKGK